jgi:hypothetical protein
VAGVQVGPDDIDTRSGGEMDFQAGRFFSGIEWNWHLDSLAAIKL